ncbi:MAG TPA: hypothetical protein VIY49_18485 [Bryobacteraceae bacterium]
MPRFPWSLSKLRWWWSDRVRYRVEPARMDSTYTTVIVKYAAPKTGARVQLGDLVH